jgi:ABC-type bacteriocin/lantibiotic exporter with double-glycine peptidase domain
MFVEELPEKFETQVGVGGEKLSGGQVGLSRMFHAC